MPDLPRLKPDPLPAIHPVPEYAADPDLSAVYEQTKHGLGVPWMGVVAMAFAHYPQFYKALWSAVEPIVGRARFVQACDQLRAVAEQQSAKLAPHPIRNRLHDLGYDDREIADIVACNDVFSAGNMPYVLLATVARLLLEGQEWHGVGTAGPTARQAQRPKPILIEPHHADATTYALYQDIQDTLGLPFVNTDYRAFARWPSYFALGWDDLKTATKTEAYTTCVHHIHLEALRLVQTLPNTTSIQANTLRAAAAQDATAEDVLNVVRLFQWLLPGLALNVAFLRAQLVRPT